MPGRERAIRQNRSRETAWWVKCLLPQLWGPEFSLRHPHESLGLAVHVFNPVVGRQKQEDPWDSLGRHARQLNPRTMKNPGERQASE